MKPQIRILLAAAAAAAVVLSTMGSKPMPIWVWNASKSVPVGLYRVRPADKLDVTDLVVALPPEPLSTFLADGGYLPLGVSLIKRVLALSGHTVCRIGLSIVVNDVEMGSARRCDRRGRTLPIWQGCRVLATGEVFLMNWDEPDSLDGRYFGPIPVTAVVGRAYPLWTSEVE